MTSVGTGHNLMNHLAFNVFVIHPPTTPTNKIVAKEIYRLSSYTKSIKLFSACIFYIHRLLRFRCHHTPHYSFWSINRINLVQQLYDFLIINWLSSVSWMLEKDYSKTNCSVSCWNVPLTTPKDFRNKSDVWSVILCKLGEIPPRTHKQSVQDNLGASSDNLGDKWKQVLGTLENVAPGSEKQTSKYVLHWESSGERNVHNKKRTIMTHIWVCLVKYVIDSVEWSVMFPYTGRTETGLNESRVRRIRNLFQMHVLQRWFRNITDCHGKAKMQHWKVSRKGSTNICQEQFM